LRDRRQPMLAFEERSGALVRHQDGAAADELDVFVVFGNASAKSKPSFHGWRLSPVTKPRLCSLIEGQTDLFDLFGRHPFLKLSRSISPSPCNSGLLANCSASFPKSLFNAAGSV